MKNVLCEVLEKFGYPVFEQGSLNEDEKYPDSFFTFWNNNASGGGFYDNEDHRSEWDFDVNFYSNDPEIVQSTLMQAKQYLRKSGAIVAGSGYDVASDEPTHSGRGMNVIFMEV